jgi:hypothetical protein
MEVSTGIALDLEAVVTLEFDMAEMSLKEIPPEETHLVRMDNVIAAVNTVDVGVLVNTVDEVFLEDRNTVVDFVDVVWPEGIPGEASQVLMDRGFGVEVQSAVYNADIDSREAKELGGGKGYAEG